MFGDVGMFPPEDPEDCHLRWQSFSGHAELPPGGSTCCDHFRMFALRTTHTCGGSPPPFTEGHRECGHCSESCLVTLDCSLCHLTRGIALGSKSRVQAGPGQAKLLPSFCTRQTITQEAGLRRGVLGGSLWTCVCVKAQNACALTPGHIIFTHKWVH